MKKSVFASVKPLAMATAVAAGTTVSMIAVALPGGDTSGANGTVTETLCHNPATMTISSGVRSVVTTTGACQVRTLPPTKGLVLTESASSASSVTDSSALVNAGGELYETYVAGDRSGTVLLTPNRALAITRSSSFASGTDGAVSFDLGAAVQPSTGLQSAWLTGTYNIMNRVHDYQDPASNLTTSPYATPNPALGERYYTTSMTVSFNGDGTCDIDNWDQHQSFSLTKDPMMAVFGEMDNGCTTGGGQCGQSDGNNYTAMGNVNLGSTGSQVNYADWGDANADDNYSQGSASGDCSYTVNSGVVSVTYNTDVVMGGSVDNSTSWTVDYNVSSDLRYLVAAESGVESFLGGYNGENEGAALAVGVRTGGGDVEGKTYLYNSTNTLTSLSTPNTPSYENPVSPTYQTEECVTRGSIAFGSTDMGGGFKDCTVNSVSSCAGRKMSGYEESSNGAADGTVTDNLTAADGADAALTACRWKNTAGLVVEMDTTDPDNNAITVTYSGDVSDNDEALVLQGSYAVTGAVPDVENSPILPQMQYNIISFVVGQEYQGSLSGDADSDTSSNWNEFVWAKDVTPSAGDSDNDYNNDAVTDVLLKGTGAWRLFTMTNGVSSANAAPALYASGWSLVASEDFDADGDTDVLLRNDTSGAWRMFIMESGAVQSNSAFGAYSDLSWVLRAVEDFNADGTPDVLLQGASGWRVFLVANGVTSSNVAYGAYASGWDFAAAEDFDADGDADVLLKKTGGGGWRIFTTQAGGTSSNAALGLYATGWNLVAADDFDGDGDADVIGRATGDNSWRTFLIQNNAVVSNAAPGLYNSASWVVDRATDVNADGDADILMRDTSTGAWRLFNIDNGVAASNTTIGLYASTAWVTQDVNDFDGDGTDDVLLRNTSTGDWRTFRIVNGTVASNANPALYSAASWVFQN